MKVFFDTNVYVAEALLGAGAREMIEATGAARWRIYSSHYVLDELEHVLVDELGFSKRLASLTCRRILHRSSIVTPTSGEHVPDDPKDSPILGAALVSGADYLVTNDRHLLRLDPFEGLRIISMDEYYSLLRNENLIP